MNYEEVDSDESNEDSYDNQSNELNEIEMNSDINVSEDKDKSSKCKKNNKEKE